MILLTGSDRDGTVSGLCLQPGVIPSTCSLSLWIAIKTEIYTKQRQQYAVYNNVLNYINQAPGTITVIN